MLLVSILSTTAAAMLLGLHQPSNPGDLEVELRRRMLEEGLTVADFSGQPRMTLIRFGEYHPVFAPFPKDLLTAVFSPSGRAVAGVGWPDSKLGVFSMRGAMSASIPGQVFNPSALALSADEQRVAICGTYSPSESRFPKERMMGIHVAFITTGRIVRIKTFISEDDRFRCGQMSWSPDGRRLVYEYDGEIFLCDIESSVSRFFLRGQLPSWSPDGQWIAYRDESLNLRLISPAGAPDKLLHGGGKVCGGLRWSPDGKYLAFGENDLRPPYIASRLLVLRLSDGSIVSVRDSGHPDIGRDQAWIYFDFSRMPWSER